MAWTILLGAGLLEIVWAIALTYTGGSTRLWPNAIGVSAAVTSFFLLSSALKSLPVGHRLRRLRRHWRARRGARGIVALVESVSPLRLGVLALILVIPRMGLIGDWVSGGTI